MESIDLFEVLVRENTAMLSSFLRTTVPHSVADDIWQDTMMTAWRRWDDYDRTRPFGAWLRGIASKNVQAWYRKNAKEHVACDAATLEYFSEAFGKIHGLPGDTFDDKLVALRQCISALPDSYQETIRLRYEEDLMPAALAKRLARKTEAVKKQLQRGKSMLFECISRKLNTATN